MTDRIQHIIEEIRSKKNELSNLLKIEQEKSAKIAEMNAQLQAQLEEKMNAEQRLTDSTLRLSTDLENANQEIHALNQRLKSSFSENNSLSSVRENVQIDELVREIEYCIGQLKNNA